MAAAVMDDGHWNCRDYYVRHDQVNGVCQTPNLGHQQLAASRKILGNIPFRFFDLPVELRTEIYSYLLPSSNHEDRSRTSGASTVESEVKQTRPKVLWWRGQTNLLVVNRAMHEECVSLLYGKNPFSLFITYDQIFFRYCWILDSGLTPVGELDILTVLPPRYLSKMRRLDLHIEHPDDYTGMIKYNVGGAGLTYGLREQVRRLTAAIASSGVPALGTLHVCLRYAPGQQQDPKRDKHHGRSKGSRVDGVQIVLEPLKKMPKCHAIWTSGDVSPASRQFLCESLEDAKNP